jgi:hypothetical protein
VDQDCDDEADDGLDCDGDTGSPDQDGDGVVPPIDCDDSDPDISPLEDEVCDDGVDNNCDGEIDEECSSDVDLDGDGYLSEADGGEDCDDSDADVNPGQIESSDTECEDGLDNDCDGDTDEDDDGCDSGTPIDEREDLLWIAAVDNTLGINCELVFSAGVDCDDVAITGDAIQENWEHDSSNLVFYLDEDGNEVSEADSGDGFGWFDLEDGLYRVTWVDDDENYASYSTYCETSQDDDPDLGASALCHDNVDEQGNDNGVDGDDGHSICLLVDEGEIYEADDTDCDALR